MYSSNDIKLKPKGLHSKQEVFEAPAPLVPASRVPVACLVWDLPVGPPTSPPTSPPTWAFPVARGRASLGKHKLPGGRHPHSPLTSPWSLNLPIRLTRYSTDTGRTFSPSPEHRGTSGFSLRINTLGVTLARPLALALACRPPWNQWPSLHGRLCDAGLSPRDKMPFLPTSQFFFTLENKVLSNRPFHTSTF